jgi:putative protein-disulfide isomerase
MKLIYVYDALCGWCYGFSSVIEKFATLYKNEFEVEVISGGMITGDRIGPIGEVAPYISWAYKNVEEASGVKFGTDFLDKTLKKGTAIFTSIPAAIALSIIKEKMPQQSLAFAAALQKAIYFDGIEPTNLEEYAKIGEKFGFNQSEFLIAMESDEYKNLAALDFKKSQELQVSGYPTVFIEVENNYYKIAAGYNPFENIENSFLQIKKNLK